jgi:hypothetical protein
MVTGQPSNQSRRDHRAIDEVRISGDVSRMHGCASRETLRLAWAVHPTAADVSILKFDRFENVVAQAGSSPPGPIFLGRISTE